ncbi:MAG: TSUP family transporter, partial [Phormidesmis sp.]
PGLLFTGLPVSSAIATNKLCGTFGALTSSAKFAQSQQVDWRVCALMALPVAFGSYLGSRSIDRLPSAWAEPVVIVLITAISVIVVFNPGFGSARPVAIAAKTRVSFKQIALSISAGAASGFHDGFFGPGTGIFLVFALLSLWPFDFLRATGTTKVLNFVANAIALVTFAAAGSIQYDKGLSGAAGVIIGSFLGATFATKKGTKLIKPLFIAVTTALVGKLLFDYAMR